jgi:hypothetical protein
MALPRNEGELGSTVCCQVGISIVVVQLTSEEKSKQAILIEVIFLINLLAILFVDNAKRIDFMIIIIFVEHNATIEYFQLFNK